MHLNTAPEQLHSVAKNVSDFAKLCMGANGYSAVQTKAVFRDVDEYFQVLIILIILRPLDLGSHS